MTQESYKHLIAPPPELWSHWYEVSRGDVAKLATRAAQWGADQELEACCGWVHRYASLGKELRAARRDKPPSLKEQALAILNDAHRGDLGDNEMATIRRALEQLPDNE